MAYLSYLFQPSNEVAALRLQKLGKRKWAVFQSWVEQVRGEEHWLEKPTSEILDAILEKTGYLDQFDSNDPTELTRIENVKELRSVALLFPELSAFLEQVALVENDKVEGQEDNKNAVTLMSLHAAKGLEFPIVFLVGMEEGLFPHSRALLDKEQMEEERRLCYVGITRAREKLYLSFAKERLLYGSYQQHLPSRFLKEIPGHLVENSERSQPAKRTNTNDPDLLKVLYDDMSIEEWLNS